MVGFVPKFQPSMTKIVGGVCVQRNKMATILYMRIHIFWATLAKELNNFVELRPSAEGF